MANDIMMQAALEYAANGLKVFPLKPKDKFPIYEGGFKIATTDPYKIGSWWRKTPNANIGIACGAMSGIFVVDLDVDENKGINGYETLMDWQRTLGKELPDTANTITGRGGYHLLYRTTKHIKSRVNILPGIDIRGDGGYIVAPPSIHPNGRPYEWEQSIDEYGIAEANETVFALLSSGDKVNAESFNVPNTIPSGARNDTIYKMACSLQAKSFSDEAIRSTIETENRNRCDPPLDSDEIEKILESVF